MASILQVEQIQGPTSGANANTITIPSGQTLDINGTLTGDGSQLTNLPGGGKVLQVVQVTKESELNTTSGSLVDLGLTASITPSSTSSKILIMTSFPLRKNNGTTNSGLRIDFRRNDSLLKTINYWHFYHLVSSSGGFFHFAHNYLDSPNTTSSTEYKLVGAAYNAGDSYIICDSGAMGSLILVEIAG